MISLGRGRLTWTPRERRSDRYGAVFLIPEGHDSFTPGPSQSMVEATPMVLDFYGELIALVRETRESTHIGDIFRGVFPTTPEVGESIVLGEGTLFYEELPLGCGMAVGLKPRDRRQDLWLDINALYRAHEQSVELFFKSK